jgi:lysophospholipase L1-like esterase
MGNILVADGDSITIGFQNSGPFTPYTSYLNLNNSPWFILNNGVSGETLAAMLSSAPTAVDPFYGPSGTGNCVVIWGGTNDITEGATPADTYANLVAYVAARHAVGWKVIVPTMLSRVGEDAEKNEYNALILANTAGADAIVDFTQTPLGIDGGYSNPTYFDTGGIHPTLFSVTTIEAPYIQAAINSLNISSTQKVSLLQSVGLDVSGSTGSAVITLPQNVNVGDTIVVSISPLTYGVSITNFSDSLGLLWTLQTVPQPAGYNSYVYTATARSGGPCVITAILSGASNDVMVSIATFSGVVALDVKATVSQGYQTEPLLVTTPPTNFKPELVVSIGDFYYGGNIIPGGYSAAAEWGSFAVGFHNIGYKFASSTGPQSASWAYAGSAYSSGVVLTFSVIPSTLTNIFGFSPNRYTDVQNEGLRIYVSPGEINGVLIPGVVVKVPANATTFIGMNAQGTIVLGGGTDLYPIASVVAGQIVTSGGTGKNANYSNGIITITDLRPTTFSF